MRARKYVSSLAVTALVALTLVLAGGGSAGAGAQQLVGAFGKANIGGQTVYVHTVSIVGPGERAADVAAASLAAQGARPISSAEFQATGLKLPDLTLNPDGISDARFKYIDGTPVPSGFDAGAVESIFASAIGKWATAAGAVNKLTVEGLGSTSAVDCPSLVRDCGGGQYTDGSNDVGWVDIKGRSTLGVTWYTTSSNPPEADIALDLNQNWCIAPACGNRDIDILSVVLHEFGHAFGLGHEEQGDTVMNAYYGGVNQDVGADDICGLQFIYDGAAGASCGGADTGTGGGGGGDCETPGAMTATTELSRSGPGGRDLIIDVTVTDNCGPVAGADEWIQLDWSGDGTTGDVDASGGPASTDDSGSVRWRLRYADGDHKDASDWTAKVYVGCTSGPAASCLVD